jgi:glyoxylase-like metal-dependent hydrolase (beta-lactamase superfamily II)
MLKVECIVNGILEENCYIIHNDKDALIVDPGSQGIKIINKINELKVHVKAILITHYHFDHVGALEEIKNQYKVDVIDYKSKNKNIDGFKYKKIENFGHTMDSVSYLFENDRIMFTGDFVFKDSIGKYDEENEYIMFESLKKFAKLDDDITIYPGHGPSSTIWYEKRYNYFLRGI